MNAPSDRADQDRRQHEVKEGVDMVTACPIRDYRGRQEEVREQL